MIVHILPPANGFPAVNYNTDKVDRNKGELMKVCGFGALQGLQHMRPEDYKNHLAMISATNKHVKRPQFHVVISAEGKSYDKHQLTAIGGEWLKAMGYEKQPYLIIFHKDTENNHVHLVTSRIDHSGKKISDRFEKIRAVVELNRVMGVDVKQNAKADIETALAFRFATGAQFRMILESKGYVLRERDGQYQVVKFGKVLDSVNRGLVMGRVNLKEIDQQRKMQVKALFHKYAAMYSTSLEHVRNGYRSEFSTFLKESFGIALMFHASGDKPPYGYSVIDHAGRTVFKGSEIMPLKNLLAMPLGKGHSEMTSARYEVNLAQLDYYAALLKAALYNYPDFSQGLQHQGLVIFKSNSGFTLHDPSSGVWMNTSDLLNKKECDALQNSFSQGHHVDQSNLKTPLPLSGISLASDVDDTAILGMKRRRKKKARTNLR